MKQQKDNQKEIKGLKTELMKCRYALTQEKRKYENLKEDFVRIAKENAILHKLKGTHPIPLGLGVKLSPDLIKAIRLKAKDQINFKGDLTKKLAEDFGLSVGAVHKNIQDILKKRKSSQK